MCAGAENGEKCGDGAGVAERAQTGEGSWNTCIAKVWWHLFVKWPEKRLWFPFFFFFSLSSGFHARGVTLQLLWKTQWLCCFENDLFPFMIFGKVIKH